MDTTKTLFVTTFAALVAGAMANQSKHAINTSHASIPVSYNSRSHSSRRAIDLLLRSMEGARSVPVSAIISTRRSMDDDTMMSVKYEQFDGKMKLTVLAPLSLQGITSIDNLHESKTYLPDENKVIVQASSRGESFPPKDRMEVAERNYRFSVEPGFQIAGQKAIVVFAQPNSSDMPARRYYLDEDNNFLLRLETLFRGDKKVLKDTKMISYPVNLPDELFNFGDFLEKPRYVKADKPCPVHHRGDTKNRLGFKLVVPDDLPYGFVVQEKQTSGAADCPFGAVRLTDGLAMVTAYQWDTKKQQQASPWPNHKGEREVKGIRIRVVGEVSDAALGKLLDSFVKEAMKGLQPYLETLPRKDLLNNTERAPAAPKDLDPEEENGQIYVLIEWVEDI